jgi:formylglycine-generating enzyme required for sulfatase activity
MIERLVKILRNAGLEDVTAVEIAEMILLADAFPVADLATAGGEATDTDARDEPTPPGATTQPPQTADRGLPPESAPPQPPQASVLDSAATEAAEHDTESEGEGVEVAPFRAPRANPLPGERRIARALRPLRRRHASTRRFILDEEKTIRRIADGGPISPVLQPAPEAWLEVALVFDESVTMRVWRQTLERLQHLFERCGYFRDVRTWRLNTESDEALLYRATAAGGPSRPLHRPGELLDPSGRRLIVVVSDCHAPAWHNGAAYARVHEWALKSPVALVQVQPEPFWAGTTMTPVDAALRAPKSAATNRLLQIAQAPYRKVVAAGGVALPVVTLDEWAIAPWARAVAGAGGVSISGLIIPPPEAMASARAAQPKPETGDAAESLTAAERVENFFNSGASHEARQLARYLASAPLSLPVMQLVQQTMLPQSRQSHLAEVFLSGLLFQAASHRNPDEIIYEFYAGVRDELRRFVTEADILRVIYEVSRYIESRIGEGGDFEAALAVPAAGGAVRRLDPLSLRFATLSAEILRRFGRYPDSVLKLERLAGLAPAANGEATEKKTQTEEEPGPLGERIFRGAMGELSANEIAGLLTELWPLPAIEVLRLAKSERGEWRGDGFYEIAHGREQRLDPKENEITELLKLATDRCRATCAPQVVNQGTPAYSSADVALAQSNARRIAHDRPADTPYVTLGGQYRLQIAIEAVNGLADEFPDGLLFAEFDDAADAPERVLQSFIHPFIPLNETVPERVNELVRRYQAVLAERRTIVLLNQAAQSELNPIRVSRAGFEAAVNPLIPPPDNVMIVLRSGVDLSKPSRESLQGLLAVERGAYASILQQQQTAQEPKAIADLQAERRRSLAGIRKTEIELLAFDRPTVHRSIEMLRERTAKRPSDTMADLMRPIEELMKTDSPEARNRLLVELGGRFLLLGSKEDARECYKLALCVVPDKLDLQIDALIGLGNCSLPDVTYWEMALENAIVEERRPVQLSLLLSLGEQKAETSAPDTLAIYERAMALAESLDRHMVGRVHEALGEFHHRRQDFDNAVKQYLAASNAFSSVGRKQDQAQAFSRLGDLYQNRKMHNEALNFYEQALEVWKSGMGDDELHARTLEKTCMSLDELGRREEASKAAEQARERFRALKLDADLARLDEYLRQRGPALRVFQFETLTLDKQGKKVETRRLAAYQFIEELEGGVKLKMVEIPAGAFKMGSPEGEGDLDERPQHEVSVPSFYIGKFAVTQAQWRVVAAWPRVTRDLKPDPSRFNRDDRPVERVSWEDAQEFCARLSQKTKRAYRLPSEAEWEYACRAGTTSSFAFGHTITKEIVNYDGKETVAVGSLGVANAFGLYDMHGNVWEWCEDVWHETYRNAPRDGSSWLSGGDSGLRVLRGGSWFNHSINCRSANRNGLRPDAINLDIGFRVVVGARVP